VRQEYVIALPSTQYGCLIVIIVLRCNAIKHFSMDTTLTIRIDKELEQMLEEASMRSGQSKSELVRQALKRQLSIESFQQLRKELLPYGEAQGWLTDEDVFREVS